MRISPRALIPLALGLCCVGASALAQDPTWASPTDRPLYDLLAYANWAFDSHRGRAVCVQPGQTWELDDLTWIRKNPAQSPTDYSSFVTMAFDPVRGVTVALTDASFCGATPFVSTFWEWDGEEWNQRPFVATPHHSAVIGWHGGANPGLIVRRLPAVGTAHETYRYSGGIWTLVATDTFGEAHKLRSNDLVYAPSTGLTFAFCNSSTIAWNGTTWIQAAATNGGITLSLARSIAHHPQNDSLVVICGRNQGIFVQQIEVDLQSWPVEFHATYTPILPYTSILHDAPRRRLLARSPLNGGLLTQQGGTWSQMPVQVTTGPSGRTHANMAYHQPSGRCVLFGGWDGSLHQNDTWSFDGRTWTDHGASAVVSPRIQPGMISAGFLGTLLFGGGRFSGQYFNDLYSWAGADWVPATTTGILPPPRMGHDVAFDSHRTRIVVHGGYNGTTLSDTWEASLSISGWQWTQLAAANPPSARHSFRMAYDERRQKMVLFGGQDAFGQFLGETWELSVTGSSATWTQRVSAQSPSPRWNPAMDYDPARGVVVLTGGYSAAGHLNDVWEWNGSTWRERVVPLYVVSPRDGAAFTYAPSLQRFVLQGGYDGSSYSSLTAYYNAPNDRLGQGMSNNAVPLRCTSAAVAGGTAGFGFNSPQGIGWLVVHPAPAPEPTFTLGAGLLCNNDIGWLYPPMTAVAEAFGPQGAVSFGLPQGLAGQGFVVQGLLFDSSWCLVLTDPMAVTIAMP
jgi:hypothetical protein